LDIISVKNLTKVFENKIVLDNISFEVPKGQVLGVIGENGAGKTTLLKLITGLLIPDAGSVLIDGKPNTIKSTVRKISLQLEGNRNFYWDLSLIGNIKYFYGLRGLRYNQEIEETIKNYLYMLGLYDHKNKLVSNLSRGMQQKASLLLNFIIPSELVILDEPTLGLDIFSSEELKLIIENAKNENRTIIISSHQLDFLEEISDRILVLKNGNLVLDSTPINLIENFAQTEYIVKLNNSLTRNKIKNLLNISDKVIGDEHSHTLSIYSNSSSILKDIISIIGQEFIIDLRVNSANLNKAYKEFIVSEDLL
jgi:ABC-2 type transport system ATP-binding protein